MSEVVKRDKNCVWHPYSSFLDENPMIEVVKAEGIYFYTSDNQKIMDCISSWWVNIHGHSHPYLAQAIAKQALNFEHIIFAGFTHAPAVELAERLLSILPNKQKRVFYSDDGSTACEVAIKMALQYFHNQGDTTKNKIIALEGSYHGDTFGAMSVGERSAFSAPFQSLLFDVSFLDFPSCYTQACCVGRREAPNCLQVRKIIKDFKEMAQTGEYAAFIYEPLIQGASGMRMYSPEILDELIGIAQENNIICIADEVMTGFGRTGKLFASEYCKNQPDIVCLSKGITGGTMPLGVTTCSEKITAAFQTADKLKTFFHGHSFTANPLACAVSLASMDLLLQKDTIQNISRIAKKHLIFEERIKNIEIIKNVRCLGTIIAIEIENKQETGYFNNLRNKMYQHFLQKNILLRPLGNILYILPPYIITDSELEQVYNEIETFLNLLINQKNEI